MLLSLRERFGNISTALIWSLGNRKVNCTMYRGKIDFQEHLALYYWVWNEIKAILLGHKLLPATMGKVYKLYLGLIKTWCIYLYTHTHTCTCWFFFSFVHGPWYLGLVLQAFLLTLFPRVPIMRHFASCNKSVLQGMWSFLFHLKMKNHQASFPLLSAAVTLFHLTITWCLWKKSWRREYQGTQ